MSKLKRVIERNEIFHGIRLRNSSDGFGEYFGAIDVDDETVSFSISEGDPICPILAVELMVSIDAIATRFPPPWHLPAAVHVSWDDGVYNCSITTESADESKHFIAAQVIERLFRLHLPTPSALFIHFFIGPYEKHREFHISTHELT